MGRLNRTQRRRWTAEEMTASVRHWWDLARIKAGPHLFRLELDDAGLLAITDVAEGVFESLSVDLDDVAPERRKERRHGALIAGSLSAKQGASVSL